jgi:hypothetical protein
MSDEVLDYVPGAFYDDMGPSQVLTPAPTPMPAQQMRVQPQVPMLPQRSSVISPMGSNEHKFLAVPGQDMMPGALAAPMPSQYVQYPEYDQGQQQMVRYPGPIGAMGQELTEDQKAARMAVGVSVVAVGAGAAVGYTYGGIYGAFAGALFGGATVNAYRAYANVVKGTDAGDKEAKVSGTYAVVTAALGGFLWYKLVEKDKSKMMANPGSDGEDDGPDEPEDEPEVLPTQGACSIRKAE